MKVLRLVPINLFRAADPVIKSLKWKFCSMWSNKQTCWGQAAPSGGQTTLENIFRSLQQRWAFSRLARRSVTLLFVSDQNRFFCCYSFFSFFFPFRTPLGNGLRVAAVAGGNRRDKQRGASTKKGGWRERGRDEGRERSSERGLRGSASTTLVLFSLLHYKNSWQMQPRHRQRSRTPARKRRCLKIRIGAWRIHWRLPQSAVFKGNVPFSSWPPDQIILFGDHWRFAHPLQCLKASSSTLGHVKPQHRFSSQLLLAFARWHCAVQRSPLWKWLRVASSLRHWKGHQIEWGVLNEAALLPQYPPAGATLCILSRWRENIYIYIMQDISTCCQYNVHCNHQSLNGFIFDKPSGGASCECSHTSFREPFIIYFSDRLFHR